MKMPLQLKIAELEQRIERLEAAKQPSSQPVVKWDAITESHWQKMWKHFDAVFGRVFR